MDIQQLRDALTQSDSSVRLKAVLAAGTHPDDVALDVLVAQCSHESDFYVRDMLTWAITRLPRDITIPAVRAELASPIPQARSQALHTLSKIRVPEAWPWIFLHMLRDDDDEVVRVAWRLAVAIVPEGAEPELADVLVSQFDRGNMEVKTSLARALASLAAWYTPALDLVDAATRSGDLGVRIHATATRSGDLGVRIHATATRAIIHDPEIGFAGIFAEAKRSLGG